MTANPPPAPSADESDSLRRRLAAAGVHSLLVQFTDLHGVPKGKLVPLAELATVLATGAGFAGPSIAGTGLPRSGPRSEYYARGDAATLQPLPWLPGIARIVGDGHVDGRPFEACPRQVLRRTVDRLAERGWRLETGLEPEFFLLREEHGRWQAADADDQLDKPSYDLKSLARQLPFLQALRESLEACGFEVLQIDHEDAHGQYELNFRHADALASADRLMLFQLAAQALAEARGMVFSTMPKPFADQPGSGLHFHVSLWHGETPLFESQPELLRHFVAGVLAHAPGLSAVAAPLVNSYKRLAAARSLSGTTWAPVAIAHGENNRTALVRTLPGRFEWRQPDAAANVYLASAALIAAGLDGIDRRLEPGPAFADDLYHFDAAALQARGLRRLPADLAAAADALEADAVLSEALGAATVAELLAWQRAEWRAYTAQVGEWELRRYAAR